ncbi:MAG: hypothetical protein KDA80_01250 [Planctomycetaceae bacterium]|nr:hypothetical protein [Planctomycetaceae bacterium]
MPSRNGRFQRPSGTAGGEFPIVVAGKDADVYRVFNSGDIDFVVKYKKNNTPEEVTVQPRCAVDVTLEGDLKISFAGPIPANQQLEGIYDLVGSDREVRSGRFKAFINDTNPLEVVVGKSNDFYYRILNSGDNAFDVITKSGANPTTVATLAPTLSLDVTLQRTLTISTNSTDDILVEGIYETLGAESTRNGRFKGTWLKAVPLKIVDFSQGSAPSAFYRLFNSGENDIVVVLDTGVEHTLPPDQSIDVKADKSGSETIFVYSTAVAKPIEGIYQFLGSE